MLLLYFILVPLNKGKNDSCGIPENLHEIEVEHGAVIGTRDWLIRRNLVVFSYVLLCLTSVHPTWRRSLVVCDAAYRVLQLSDRSVGLSHLVLECLLDTASVFNATGCCLDVRRFLVATSSVTPLQGLHPLMFPCLAVTDIQCLSYSDYHSASRAVTTTVPLVQ